MFKQFSEMSTAEKNEVIASERRRFTTLSKGGFKYLLEIAAVEARELGEGGLELIAEISGYTTDEILVKMKEIEDMKNEANRKKENC